ncbi:Antitoxin ParD [Novosphingobium sp. CF614]|uniref:antitoxin n=1 Tax=Novosphingobium sp. CF614 TaxID=1884364 RepID=UPI0008E88A6E|nr:antitoxin [Novosphingobium sp. CF614]SFG20919.1 Antitoxin ParD [Novosphingobium sp. CF614]
MSRLTIDISPEQHQSLKAMAALEGKTIRQYALERLFSAPAPQPGDPEEETAWQEFLAFLNARAEAALAGEMSTKSLDDIFGEALAEERAGRT